MKAQTSEKVSNEQKVKEIQQLRKVEVVKATPQVNTQEKKVAGSPDQQKVTSASQIKVSPVRKAVSTNGVQTQPTILSKDGIQSKDTPEQKPKKVQREIQKSSPDNN